MIEVADVVEVADMVEDEDMVGGVEEYSTGQVGNTAGVSDIDNWIPLPNLQLDTAPPTTPFTETPGPQISLTSDSNPVEFFSLFLMRLY